MMFAVTARAWMAMLYAQKHPHRVTRVILINGGPSGTRRTWPYAKGSRRARRTLDAALDPSTPRRPNFVLDDLVRVSNRGPISRLLAAGVGDMSKYLLEDKLAGFQLPVDLIWGASDRLVRWTMRRNCSRSFRSGTLTVIEHCGHTPQLERPIRELTRVLLQILASGASSASDAAHSVTGQHGENP